MITEQENCRSFCKIFHLENEYSESLLNKF